MQCTVSKKNQFDFQLTLKISAWRPRKTEKRLVDQDHRRMSSGYPGHSGGAGHSSGHHSQSNPPTSSSTMSRGALPANTSTSQILPPSASSSQSTAQASPSQRSSSSASSAKAKWYFTPERLSNTPSVDAGIPIEKELSYRQQAANFIQDMGQRLKV